MNTVDTIATYPAFRTQLTDLIDSLDNIYDDTSIPEKLKASKFYEVLTSNGML